MDKVGTTSTATATSAVDEAKVAALMYKMCLHK